MTGGVGAGAPQPAHPVLRAWRVDSQHDPPSVVRCDHGAFELPAQRGEPLAAHEASAAVPARAEATAEVSALAAAEGLVVVTRNSAGRPGFADVWRAEQHAGTGATPLLVPLRRLQGHSAPLYACAVSGGRSRPAEA